MATGCADRRELSTDRPFEVLRVIDGDTFVIRYDGEPTSCRIVGIDAPERDERGFEESMRGLAEMIERSGGAVRIEFPAGSKRDDFGRLLVGVEADGVDLGDAMMERDLAEPSHYDEL